MNMKKCHGKVKMYIWKDEKDQRFSIIIFIFMTLPTKKKGSVLFDSFGIMVNRISILY